MNACVRSLHYNRWTSRHLLRCRYLHDEGRIISVENGLVTGFWRLLNISVAFIHRHFRCLWSILPNGFGGTRDAC
jgi:hypothetical protein